MIQTPTKMIARKGANIDVSVAGLAGVSIGTQRATTQACYVEKFHSNADIKLYAVESDGYNDLLNGRVDVYVADSIQLQEGFLKTKASKEPVGYTYDLIPGFVYSYFNHLDYFCFTVQISI